MLTAFAKIFSCAATAEGSEAGVEPPVAALLGLLLHVYWLLLLRVVPLCMSKTVKASSR
jgi:hypothetical protein